VVVGCARCAHPAHWRGSHDSQLSALRAVDAGFDPHNVVSMVVSVTGSKRRPSLDGARIFYRELLEKVRALPGVESAGGINHLHSRRRCVGLAVRHSKVAQSLARRIAVGAIYRIATPGYLEAMRLPLLQGPTSPPPTM
jgi:hypothetical protein